MEHLRLRVTEVWLVCLGLVGKDDNPRIVEPCEPLRVAVENLALRFEDIKGVLERNKIPSGFQSCQIFTHVVVPGEMEHRLRAVRLEIHLIKIKFACSKTTCRLGRSFITIQAGMDFLDHSPSQNAASSCDSTASLLPRKAIDE